MPQQVQRTGRRPWTSRVGVAVVFTAAAVLGPVGNGAAADLAPNCTWGVSVLPLPPGQTIGVMSDSDDVERVVGYADTPFRQHHGFIWVSGQYTEVLAADGTDAVPSGVNDSGTVVGNRAKGKPQPFIWKNGKATRLAVPTDTVNVWGINNQGVIVGLDYATGHTYSWNSATPSKFHDFGSGPGAFEWIHVTETGMVVAANVPAGSDSDAARVTMVGRPSGALAPLPGLDPTAGPPEIVEYVGNDILGYGVPAGGTAGERVLLRWRGLRHQLQVVPEGTTLRRPGQVVIVPGGRWSEVLVDGVAHVLPIPPSVTGYAMPQYVMNDGTVYGTAGFDDGPDPRTPVVWRCS